MMATKMPGCVPLLLCGLLVGPALADLPEPPTNQGATQVQVEGTTVRAEAWAIALGHIVDAIVVVRYTPKAGETPAKVETYERWDLDGRKQSERGDKRLGRAWEKKLWALLDECQGDPQAPPRKREALMERTLGSLSRGGSKQIDGWIVGWSLGEGVMENGGRTSKARTAVFTLTPSASDPTTPPGKDPRAGPVTPPAGGGPAAGEPGPAQPPRAGGTVTPGGPPPLAPPLRPGFPRVPGGAAGGSAHGSGRSVVDTEQGVREHALVEVDLARLGGSQPPPAVPPSGEVTPRGR